MTTHIHRLTPYAHVADVVASIQFYKALGFEVDNTVEVHGRTVWAMLASGSARLMLAAASGPVNAEEQAVLFYLYTNDLPALRRALGVAGLRDAGEFRGGPIERRAYYAIAHPPYMPEGEMRVVDPDGYCLLVGSAE
ncbi:MAG: hypothetical protein JNM94_12170 [Phycisphaerae bacterium]|nr:hypothetical protein [Phycisphaerae bacterium]